MFKISGHSGYVLRGILCMQRSYFFGKKHTPYGTSSCSQHVPCTETYWNRLPFMLALFFYFSFTVNFLQDRSQSKKPQNTAVAISSWFQLPLESFQLSLALWSYTSLHYVSSLITIIQFTSTCFLVCGSCTCMHKDCYTICSILYYIVILQYHYNILYIWYCSVAIIWIYYGFLLFSSNYIVTVYDPFLTFPLLLIWCCPGPAHLWWSRWEQLELCGWDGMSQSASSQDSFGSILIRNSLRFLRIWALAGSGSKNNQKIIIAKTETFEGFQLSPEHVHPNYHKSPQSSYHVLPLFLTARGPMLFSPSPFVLHRSLQAPWRHLSSSGHQNGFGWGTTPNLYTWCWNETITKQNNAGTMVEQIPTKAYRSIQKLFVYQFVIFLGFRVDSLSGPRAKHLCGWLRSLLAPGPDVSKVLYKHTYITNSIKYQNIPHIVNEGKNHYGLSNLTKKRVDFGCHSPRKGGPTNAY